jgi:soluble lytic murein transglycosylase-like protein
LSKLLLFRRFTFALAALAVLSPFAQAAELITLSNGFAMRCDHHAPIEGRVRLYLSVGEDNYIEFRPEEIATVENVPNLPPEPGFAELKSAASPAAGSIASLNANQDARLSTADLGEMLTKAGHEHNLDVDLLASLVKAESGGNAHAVSRAGARGLMQLMPATARNLGVEDSFKPDQNVRGGSTYLDALLIRYHDNLALALAAYNAGPEAVDKYHGIPPYRETQAYVARVIHEFNRRVLAREADARRAAAQSRASQN